MLFKDVNKYCINLEKRPERKESVSKEFNKAGLDVEFWKAVDGNTLTISDKSSKIDQYNAKGILGCLMSHVNLIKHAQRSNMEYVAVFEDDIKLALDFNKRIKYIEDNCPDFDMFYLGGHFGNELTDIKKTKDPFLYRSKAIAGTYAYILRDTVYNYILSNVSENLGADQMFVELVQKRFKCYCFLPFLVDHVDGESDVVMGNVKYPATHKYYKDKYE
jgi:GR25 family glycosyltransferase involved in LPS biosynthesis